MGGAAPATQPTPAAAPVCRGQGAGFDFSAAIRSLCRDLVARLEPLGHIDLDRVGIGFCQARSPARHGALASLVPLRFENGRRVGRRRNAEYEMPRVHDAEGRELLYLLRFYLPRFCDLPAAEKLLTVVHELWHIGPRFDGDLRRFPGRCYAHSHSQAAYEAEVAELVEAYLAGAPPRELRAFFELDFRLLVARYGRVHGLAIRVPRLRRLS